MNARLMILPLTASVISGVWLGSQRSSINYLKSETMVLRERVAMARTALGNGSDPSLAGRMKDKREEAEGGIDWKDLGSKIAQSEHGNMPDMRAMMELQTTLMALSGEELLAELDKIDALDLPRDVRKALDGVLVGMLVKQDPKAALDRYLDQANEQGSGMSWQLSNAFQTWQKKDPAAAMAWFDAEIAKGSFDSKALDGRSDSRLRFEAVAVRDLLSSDPDDARRRVEELPEDQRKQVFNMGMFSDLKEGAHLAFAELVRSVVPEDERGEAYKSTVSGMVGKDFSKVDGFIANINASAAEKDSIVGRAAESRIQKLSWEGKIDRAAVDEVRAWAMTQSPEKADAITGKSLVNIWGEKSTFDDRARLIESLHAEGAGDDLIVSFLSDNHQARESPELSKTLAERVQDESLREKLLDSIDQK